MLVSIIIPIYNVALYIEQCIRSVMNQTVMEEVECILVDDCGQDNSVEIVERILSKYEGKIKFRVLHHDHNRGVSAARNTGIDAAKGDWIYFLDSDDRIEPECIELMVNMVKKYPDSQIVFAGTNAPSSRYKWMDYKKKKLPEYSNDHGWLQLSMLKRYDFGMTAWNKLMSRKFIIDNKLRFVEGLVYEDEVWNFDISRYIQSASFVKYNTYNYNIHDNSLVSNTSTEIRWSRLFKLWDVLLSKLDNINRELYVKAVSNLILQETRWRFPQRYRIALCLLFLKLSWKSCSCLSIPLFLQGVIALCLPSKFPNKYTCSRLIL